MSGTASDLDDLLGLTPAPDAPAQEAAPSAAPSAGRPARPLVRPVAIDDALALDAAWRAEYATRARPGREQSAGVCELSVGPEGTAVRRALYAPEVFHLNASFLSDDCAGLHAEWAPAWVQWLKQGEHVGLTRADQDGCLLRWGRDAEPYGAIRYLPLIGGRRSWVILSDDRTREGAVGLIRALVLRLACMMGNDVRFVLLDPNGGGTTFPQQGLLPSHLPANNAVPAETLGLVMDRLAKVTATMLDGTRAQDFHKWDRRDQKDAGGYEVVCALDMGDTAKYNPMTTQLTDLARTGPLAGRYLLLHVNMDKALPHGFDLKAIMDDAHVIDLRECDAGCVDRPPDEALHRHILNRLASAMVDTELKVIPDRWWTKTSQECVGTSLTDSDDGLGVLFGQETGGRSTRSITAGVLSGIPGSGKSNVLALIIMGLAMRYPPEELQFHLLDLKGGVEFQAYAKLPHAAVIASNAVPGAMIGFLRNMRGEMDRRYDLFLDRDDGKGEFSDLQQYHAAGQPRGPAPRILIVIDEYQTLFDEEQSQDEAANHLKEIVSKGRAAGVHVLLSSQKMVPSGMSRSQHIMSMITLRMSLQMAADEVDSMFEFGTEGRQVLRGLQESGRILINDHGGADGFNHAGKVGVLDGRPPAQRTTPSEREKAAVRLAPLFARFEAMAQKWPAEKRAAWPTTQVLTGQVRPGLKQNFLVREALRTHGAIRLTQLLEMGGRPAAAGGLQELGIDSRFLPVPLMLGRDSTLNGQACVPLSHEGGENLLCVMEMKAARLQMDVVATVVASLAALSPDVVGSVRILNLAPAKLVPDDFDYGDAIAAGLAAAGLPRPANITVSTSPDDAVGLIGAVAPPGTADILILIDPERASPLLVGPPETARFSTFPLMERLKQGPDMGQHTIIFTSSLQRLYKVVVNETVGGGLSQLFRWVLVERVDDDLRAALRLIQPLSRAGGGNRPGKDRDTTAILLGRSGKETVVTVFGE
ncbi:FtsK/SpoIIIE domain-containing protein [Novacetimonas pomaceti]|uniref:FtsK domain-containing protein n=1 Tax=Novacetimonas pomaceti TaxID=2021998 RepID=A0ABX5P0L7_9PROT|nr:FtsK/SpoIIIE domain-containing protein [Novacetimonas pomaceti]PYD47240.1 hypothetical protein C3920_10990 [Novacetimonas pomaceti]